MKSWSEIKKAKMDKLTDEEAEALLKKLSIHYKQPVMPIGRYCKSLWTWMDCVEDAYREDGSKPTSRFANIAVRMQEFRISIQKSNLLWRLIYNGQPLRTQKCPVHQGHWSGIAHPDHDCEHGCGLTGWIPEPDFQPSVLTDLVKLELLGSNLKPSPLESSLSQLVDDKHAILVSFHRTGTHGGKLLVKVGDAYHLLEARISDDLKQRNQIDDAIYEDLKQQLTLL